MPILRDFLSTSFGAPSQAVLPLQKKRNMTQQEFYQAQQDNQRTLFGSPVDQTVNNQQQQYANDPRSQDYVNYGLQSMANRKAPPELSPGSRVQTADKSQYDPNNFASYYSMLGSITDIGNQQLAAAQAKAAYKRQQSMMAAMNTGGGASVGSTGSGSYVGSVPSNPAANFKFAQQIAPNYGWDANQLAAWYRLGMKESGWRNTAQNPTSTAYGIGQFLDSTWKGYGIAKTSDPALQVEAMARYIKARYGTPANALAFHNSHNWY